MGRRAAVARQHEADRDLDGGVLADHLVDLLQLFAAIHDEAAAAIGAVGVADLAAGLDRVVIVEAGLGLHRVDGGHFMHARHVPGGDAGLGQGGQDLARGIALHRIGDEAREEGEELLRPGLQLRGGEAEHRLIRLQGDGDITGGLITIARGELGGDDGGCRHVIPSGVMPEDG